MTTKTLLATTTALLLAACGGADVSHVGQVSIQADMSALRAIASVVVEVRADPARVTTVLQYDAGTDRYAGSMALPAGPQTLSVQALSDTNEDGQLEVVAVGNAQTTVVESQTASVLVAMLDLTAPLPVPDHRPIITSAGVSNSNPRPGETVSAWVSAVDVDEDPLTYAWTVECNTGTATIGDPIAAATTISVDAAATCTVRASVTANGKAVTANIAMQVGGSGQAEVVISFVAPPVVSQVLITAQASGFTCFVDRAGNEATCADALGKNELTEVYLALSDGTDGAEASLDVCGGVVTRIESGPGFARFAWQAPDTTGICMATGALTRDAYYDALPVALLLQ